MWRACERLGMKPPDVKDQWDDNTPAMQAVVFTYEMIRQYEEAEEASAMLGSGLPHKGKK